MKRKHLKYAAIFVILNLLFQISFPITAWALTGGPSQPEVQSFEPVGTTDMVDVSSGDFNYNIPLMDVDGYPINISYHSGITMDQEASWVGLGWNINPGTINRNVRGIPDDFDGQTVKKDFNIKDNNTFGVDLGVGVELFGFDPGQAFSGSIQGSLGVFYNSYKGMGMEWSVDPSISFASKIKTKFTASLGISGNSQSGLGVDPYVGIELETKNRNDKGNGVDAGFSVSAPYNSRGGIKQLNLGFNANISEPYQTMGQDGEIENERKDVTGFNGGSSISTCTQTYMPELSMPFNNYNFALNLKLGPAIIGAHPYGTFKGYYSGQVLVKHSVEKPAYGYLYQQDAADQDDILMDFNREKDGVFTTNSTNLPITNATYDIYSVSGQGIGGMYRPYRGDIGVVHDDLMVNNSASASAGLEFGFGDEFHFGANVNVNFAESQSKAWRDNYATRLNFQKPDYTREPLYEPAYFKNAGEKTPSDTVFYNKVGADKAIRLSLDNNETTKTDGGFLYSNSNEGSSNNIPINLSNSTYYQRARRDKRNQEIVPLTGNQANIVGLSKQIVSYHKNAHVNSSGIIAKDSMNYNSHYRPGSSIAEVTAYNKDGSRYVYGLPAYNVQQVEQTFAVNGELDAQDYRSGEVFYRGGDNSTGNSQGLDNYYSGTTTPAYAHSYLLTSVLSPDYVDLTGDGVSDDDLGNYTKFNYTLVDSNYNWRAPFLKNSASYNEGYKSNYKDDKASLMYGRKEVWMLNSVVSKNYIAEFTISKRNDGYGVKDGNGGLDTLHPSYMLTAITLYSKKDRMIYGSNAVPIKTVHFVYDYSLCRSVENNKNNYTYAFGDTTLNPTMTYGKLTLKEIYFTYGTSNKGKYSPYQFSYNSDSTYFNSDTASYCLKGSDRWGTFKPNNISGLSNQEYPYTDQDNRARKADRYAGAWELVKIELPSTGTINITYESDDYAYVENKPAMQMFKILGFGSSSSYGSASNSLYNGSTENTYVFFRLVSPLTGSTAVQQFHDRYLDDPADQGTDPGDMYFNCLVNLDNKQASEYVRGYASINTTESNTTYGLSGDTIGWIKLNTIDIGDNNGSPKQVNPISKTAWQMTRLDLPQLIYEEQNYRANSPPETITGLAGALMDIKTFFGGFNHALRSEKFASSVTLSNCWMRLKTPTKCKLGGGARVKKITNDDSWSSIGASNTSAQDFSYGKQYSYTTTEKQSDGTVMTISSGVAAYEPMIGNEENPWRTPVSYSVDNTSYPDNAFYSETPFGESFFPAPTVTYSKVTESNLVHSNVNRTATGYTVHEFYTSKDYPVIVNYTDLKTVNRKSEGLASILGLDVEHLESASQGYSIELNDMNGRPKAETVYQQNVTDTSNYLTKVEYFYNNDTTYNHNVAGKPMRLSSKVDVIYPNDTVVQNTVGMDVDATLDMRQDHTWGFSAGLDFNTEGFFLPPVIQGVVPSLFPSYGSEITQFNAAVVTKVIRRYGILTKTVAHEDGAQITTQNLAFDSETGEVLLTRTQNEFQDPVYNFTYPAHWAYDGMGPAYQNSKAQFVNTRIWPDSIVLPNGLLPSNYFSPGDLVLGTASFGVNLLMHVQQYNHHLFFIDLTGRRLGEFPGFPFNLEIIRSGRRNMQTIPIGNVTSLVNPIHQSGAYRYLSFSSSTKILNASSTEFAQNWPGQFNYIKVNPCTIDSILVDLMNFLNYFAADKRVKSGHTASLLHVGFYDSTLVFKHDIQTTLGLGTGWIMDSSKYQYSFTDSIGSSSAVITVVDSLRFNYYDSVVSFSSPQPGLNPYNFYVTVTLLNGQKVIADVQVQPGISPMFTCHNYCSTVPLTLVDPYQVGLAGQWRKKKDWAYLDNRGYSSPINTRNDGTYNTFTPFWQYAPHQWSALSQNPTSLAATGWTWSNQVTNYGKAGAEIENVDPLYRFSSAVYGYSGSMPIATANNARYKDIAYDGFEDYKYFQSSCTQVNHWDFRQSTHYTLDSTVKHTGKRSLRLLKDSATTVTRQIFNCGSLSTSPPFPDPGLYYVKPCDCVGLFSPDAGKYMISGWVKLDTSAYAVKYGSPSINVNITGATHVSKTYRASGPIVEGWQKIDSTFTVPPGDTAIAVTLNAGDSTTWYDDLRIFPFNAEMKSYAFDERSLKLLAELDENNYATIYEYDEEGNLVRVKKETINGIMTIKESRTSIIKRQP